MKTKTEKTDVSWQKKKRKTDLINSQNGKIENANTSFGFVFTESVSRMEDVRAGDEHFRVESFRERYSTGIEKVNRRRGGE